MKKSKNVYKSRYTNVCLIHDMQTIDILIISDIDLNDMYLYP